MSFSRNFKIWRSAKILIFLPYSLLISQGLATKYPINAELLALAASFFAVYYAFQFKNALN